MARYAEGTDVSSDRSQAEIQRVVRSYGAVAYGYGWEDGRALVTFQCSGRRIRFVVPLPDPNADRFILTPTGKARTATAACDSYEQEVRRLWRALALVIKAMFEAAASGIVTFEEAFLPYTLLPTGRTVAEHALPEVERSYAGQLPAGPGFLALPPVAGVSP